MTLTAEEVGEVLQTHLMGEGLYVTDCERHGDALHVGYESMALGNDVPHGEVGTVLRLLLDLAGIQTEGRDIAGIAEAGAWDPEDVNVWVFEDPGGGNGADTHRDESGEDGDVVHGDRTQKGHYEVREGWFLALREGYLSETDFSTLVLSTLE